VAEVAEKIRKALRSGARGSWMTDEAYEFQLELKKKARELLREAYQKCALEGGKPFAECLREHAAKVGLSKVYAGMWGTA